MDQSSKVRAWKDREFRQSLNELDRTVAGHPSGDLAFALDDLELVSGASTAENGTNGCCTHTATTTCGTCTGGSSGCCGGS